MFEKKEKSRFRSRSELKDIVKTIDQLKNKKIELTAAAKGLKQDTLEYKKHALLTRILDQFDEAIDKYNSNKVKQSKMSELFEIYTLLFGFAKVVEALDLEDSEILCRPRNNNKKYANLFFHYAAVAAGAALGTAAGGPFVGVVAALSVGTANNINQNSSKLNIDDFAKTGALLIQLLVSINKTLNDTLEHLNDDSHSDSHMCFENHEWLNDVELCKSNMTTDTVYVHRTPGSFSCLHKDSKGNINRHSVTEFLDKDDLLLMEKNELGEIEKVKLIYAMIKSVDHQPSNHPNQPL